MIQMFFAFLCLFPALEAQAQDQGRPIFETQNGAVELVTIADDLDSPWGFAFLPGGDILVTERPGRLVRIAPGGTKTRITGLPGNIAARGQGGLLDITLHPEFENNRLIYFSYAAHGYGGTGTEVARAQLTNTNRLTGLKTIFAARPKMRSNVHYGSRLLLTPDDNLFITLGERFDMDQAQNPENHLGSLIRLRDDGSVPEGNPFAGQDDARRPEIFSYGHRNIQGITYAPDTGTIWLHEHGPRGGDELNIARPGANYGWPRVTFGKNYDGSMITDITEKEGMASPVIHWTPSIAPSGLTYYQGDAFPAWQGNLFAGALAGRHLRRIILDGQNVTGQEVLLSDLGARIRDVKTGPDGYLYILTDGEEARLYRLIPASGP